MQQETMAATVGEMVIDQDKQRFCDSIEANLKQTKLLLKMWGADRHINKMIELERFFEKWAREFGGISEPVQNSEKTNAAPGTFDDEGANCSDVC